MKTGSSRCGVNYKQLWVEFRFWDLQQKCAVIALMQSDFLFLFSHPVKAETDSFSLVVVVKHPPNKGVDRFYTHCSFREDKH